MTRTQWFSGERKECISTLSNYRPGQVNATSAPVLLLSARSWRVHSSSLGVLSAAPQTTSAQCTGGGGTEAQQWGSGSISCPQQFLEDTLVRCPCPASEGLQCFLTHTRVLRGFLRAEWCWICLDLWLRIPKYLARALSRSFCSCQTCCFLYFGNDLLKGGKSVTLYLRPTSS